MRYAMFGALALTFALAGCAGPAGKVSVLQGDTAIAAGAPVAWAPAAGEMYNSDPRIDNDAVRQRMRIAVEQALAAKGHAFVDDAAQARYLVSYDLALQQRQADTALPPPETCGWRGCVGGHYWGRYDADDMGAATYVEGALMIELTDRSTGARAWRATSRGRVERDAAQDRISAAVQDMVRALP